MTDADREEIADLRAHVAQLTAEQRARPHPAHRSRTAVYAVVVVAAAVVFSAAYFGSPFLALHDLQQAARDGDSDRLDRLVDFPRVRDNLKSKVDAYLLQSLRSDPSMANNPFAGLGALIVPAIADRAIDAYVTPDGIAAMVNNGVPPKLSALDVAAQTPTASNAVNYSSSYADLDHFKVALSRSENPGNALTLVLERHGLFGWKLTRIDFSLSPPTPAQSQSATTPTTITPESPEPPTSADTNAATDTPAPSDNYGLPPPPPDRLGQLSAQDAQVFSRYAVPIYSGPVVFPDFAGRDRADRMFRTMILNGVHNGVAYAGRLGVSIFGCGTDCSMGYVIDLGTGEVFDLPVGGEGQPDLDFQFVKDSALLRTDWKSTVGDASSACMYEDFLWTGHGFSSLGRHSDIRPCPS